MGLGAFLVEQAPQRTASRCLQRSCRDRDDKTLFPRAIQRSAASCPCRATTSGKRGPTASSPGISLPAMDLRSPVLTIAGLPAPPTQCRAARRIARSAILRPNRSQYRRVPQQERPRTNRAPDSTAIKEIKFQGVSVRATRKPIVALWTSLVLIVPRNAERNSADLLIQEPFRRTRCLQLPLNQGDPSRGAP
jgi:hypothetical protein